VTFSFLQSGVFLFLGFRVRRAAAGGFSRIARRCFFSASAADLDHLGSCSSRLGELLMTGTTYEDADAECQKERPDSRDQGGVRRDAGSPLLLRRGSGGLRRLLHRVHQNDGVHKGQPGIAASLPTLEAVALIGRHHRAAGGAVVSTLHRDVSQVAWIVPTALRRMFRSC